MFDTIGTSATLAVQVLAVSARRLNSTQRANSTGGAAVSPVATFWESVAPLWESVTPQDAVATFLKELWLELTIALALSVLMLISKAWGGHVQAVSAIQRVGSSVPQNAGAHPEAAGDLQATGSSIVQDACVSPRKPRPPAAGCARTAAQNLAGATRCFAPHPPAVPPPQPRQEDMQRHVRRLVSLLIDGSSCPAGTYEELVSTHAKRLRSLVSDEQARAMFTSVVSRAFGSGGSRTGQAQLQTVLNDMRRLGLPRNLAFYASIMRLFASSREYFGALKLYDAMVADGVEPDKMMYICLMNNAVACDMAGRALEFFRLLWRLGTPSVRTCMVILRVHMKRGDWAAATELLHEMKGAGVKPDNLVLNHVLGLCVSVGQIDAAESAADAWADLVDVVSFNILLKGHTQQVDLPRAEALLERMASSGRVNLISYNTVMDCAVRSLQLLSSPHERRKARAEAAGAKPASDPRHSNSFLAIARRPWELLDEAVRRGLEPDRYTCSTLVKGMHLGGCSVSEIDRVVVLLKGIGAQALQDTSLHSGNGRPDQQNSRLLEVMFNTLLDACVSSKDLDRMAEIFALMRSFQTGVSAVTFGTLIKAFGQAGKLSRCLEVWEEMHRASIQPTAVTYGCYIDACLRNENLARAEQLFEGMEVDGVVPNAVIYTSLIRGYARAGQPVQALTLYQAMRRRGVDATAVTFNSVLDIVARQLSDPGRLAEVIRDMRAADVAPDVITYSILIKASCSVGNIDNALGLFEQLRQEGLVFDQVAFNTLLLACSKAGRIAEAEKMFDQMCQLGMRPTNVTISILVKMYGRARLLEKAVTTVERMEGEYGEAPNLFVYTCLIQAFAQNGQVRRSWEVFGDMLRSGVEPDGVTFGTLIHGCVYLNKFDHAMCVVRQAYLKTGLPGSESVDFGFQHLRQKRVIPLQAEVLNTLLASLRRKRLAGSIAELEAIMAEQHVVACSAASSGDVAGGDEPTQAGLRDDGRHGRLVSRGSAFGRRASGVGQ